jgi:hypothetical protein
LPAFLSVIEREIEVVEHIYNGRFQLVVFLKDLHIDLLANKKVSDEMFHID